MSVTARQGQPNARQLHCACCGRPFSRPSMRGPAPLYCSADCQKQMRVRSRVWSRTSQPQPRDPLRQAS